MPLLKLWNSLRGQSTTTPEPTTGEPKSGQSHKAETQVSSSSSTNRSQGAKRSGKATFGLFGGGSHSALCKQLRTAQVDSVLEIGVGDGSQAIAVMETLSRQSDSVRYYAIDEFEMSGGVNLKQFHQSLRNHDIRPQLFPGSVERGLMKIAHTIGSVDLILLSDASVIDDNPSGSDMVARISHEGTKVLVARNETWTVEVSTGHQFRRAA